MKVNVQIGTSVVNFVNFITVFGTGFFLKRYGRRTLYIIFPAGICVIHFILAILLWDATDKNGNSTLSQTSSLICGLLIVLYVAFFEFSLGPILWLYNAEILNDTAVTVAATCNWIAVLILSEFMPALLKSL